MTFQIQDDEKTWKSTKEGFIHKFEASYAKCLYNSFERKKTDKSMEDYVKERIETWSKLFPSLTKSELNLIVMAGISEDAIKKLKLHKHCDQETLISLCEAVVSSTPSTSANS